MLLRQKSLHSLGFPKNEEVNPMPRSLIHMFSTHVKLLRRTSLLVAFVLPLGLAERAYSADDGETKDKTTDSAVGLETATFGSGCFWCTEAVFERLEGVHTAVSGFSGGQVQNPSYKQVLTGRTGHAEVVQVTFDPEVIPYKELLEVFWKTHDPTTLNRQGPDVGTQYRSVIFYHTDEQKELATFYKKRINDSNMFRSPVVTEISPFEAFYPAEGYHQEYYDRNGRQRYCYNYIRPKINKFKKIFAEKLKKEPEPIERVRKTDSEWRAQLSQTQYQVTRKKGDRACFHRKVLEPQRTGHLQVHLLRSAALRFVNEIQIGHGLAQLLVPNRSATHRGRDRSQPRTVAYGGEVRSMRCPFGSRLQRRSSAHGTALLHQFGGVNVRRQRKVRE